MSENREFEIVELGEASEETKGDLGTGNDSAAAPFKKP